MAIHAPIMGAPTRATLLSGAATPLGRILAQFDRPKLESTIEVLVALLDASDGDPEDQQANGDELDGSMGEDDFYEHPTTGEAGCPISDPGEDEDSPTDTAWTEQADQTARQPYRARAETVADPGTGEAIGVLEDAEEDGEDQCEAGDDGCGFHVVSYRSGWGSTFDHAYSEESLQPAVTADAVANDA